MTIRSAPDFLFVKEKIFLAKFGGKYMPKVSLTKKGGK